MEESKEEFEERKMAGLVRCQTRKGPVYYNEGLQKRMDEVCVFADSIGKRDNFEEALGRVAFPTFFGKPARTLLSYDFAPYSFYFNVQIRDADGAWKFAMNGGLIFHKSDETWSVHT